MKLLSQKKIEEDSFLHNEYHFVVDVVVTIAIFMQLWEVPIFDQPC
jgi:hypothetical protein